MHRKLHPAQIELEGVPAQIDLQCRLPRPKKDRSVADKHVPGQIDDSPLRHAQLLRDDAGKVVMIQDEVRRGGLGEFSELSRNTPGEAIAGEIDAEEFRRATSSAGMEPEKRLNERSITLREGIWERKTGIGPEREFQLRMSNER
ncbi:hypothetical protein HPP92_007466 [Vanilla planifolia]|uniref:Uncharacterized protein n=1 Tax=Vanilla planifolia TaxID=51239 RepID=A0A835RI94_VANPL|nr:hypothetical protein HPP92_007466 [Vanilla planifolia]